MKFNPYVMVKRKNKRLKYVAVVVLVVSIALSMLVVSVTVLDDVLSRTMRAATQGRINQYVEYLTDRASQGRLSALDRVALHGGLLAGVMSSRLRYPEASMLLYHYVYGDGSALELPSSYFSASPYLLEVVNKLGPGEHGPIALRQAQDQRLALALNPYHLTITPETVRLYHPSISFAPVDDSRKVFTIVPIGKLNLKIYDSLVSAMRPTPFYVYSQWPING